MSIGKSAPEVPLTYRKCGQLKFNFHQHNFTLAPNSILEKEAFCVVNSGELFYGEDRAGK